MALYSLKMYNCSYRDRGRKRWRKPYEHVFRDEDPFLAGVRVEDIDNCKKKYKGPRRSKGKGNGQRKGRKGRKRRRKTKKQDSGTGRVKIHQQMAKDAPKKPAKVTTETIQRRAMTREYATVTLTAGSLLSNIEQCLPAHEATKVNERIQNCIATRLRLENDLYDIYMVCIAKFHQRSTSARAVQSGSATSLSHASRLIQDYRADVATGSSLASAQWDPDVLSDLEAVLSSAAPGQIDPATSMSSVTQPPLHDVNDLPDDFLERIVGANGQTIIHGLVALLIKGSRGQGAKSAGTVIAAKMFDLYKRSLPSPFVSYRNRGWQVFTLSGGYSSAQEVLKDIRVHYRTAKVVYN